ncbi:MAG: YbaB/EbfC family nucleoid-associated protein [bacterium]|nr:YbaB/EbfC family nucleoid-associated protein [bacterium]
MADFDQIFKKIQEAQHVITTIQSELKSKRIEGSAGGGLVKIVVNGNQDVIEVNISPELIKLKDLRFLEDLIKAASNDARQKAQEEVQGLISRYIGTGLNVEDLKTLFLKK